MKTLNTTSKLITMIALLAISVIWVASVAAKIRKNPARDDGTVQPGSEKNAQRVDSRAASLKAAPDLGAAGRQIAVTDIGPERGTVDGLAGFLIDPGNPSEILASTDNGIFKSTDGGTSWHPANVGLTSASGARVFVHNIRPDPSNPRTVFAVGAGIYRSSDFGEHWSQLAGGGNDIAVSPTDPAVLFIVSGGIFLKSTDGGTTVIAQTGIGLPEPDPTGGVFVNFTNVVITPADPQTMYVVDESSGVYKSTNSGTTFTLLSASPFLPGQVFPHPTQRDTIFLEVLGGSSTGLFRSTDGGATFTEITGGLPAGGVQFITFDPDHPATVYAASTEGLMRSKDGGFTFTSLGLKPAQLDMAGGGAIVINVDPSDSKILYVNTARGNFKSIDKGRTFDEIDNGFRAATVSALAFDNDADPALYVITDGAVLRTKDRGKHYDEITLPSDAFATAVAVAPTNPNRIVVTTSSAGILRSTNGGRSWKTATVDNGSFQFRGAHIAFDPQDERNVYVADVGLFRSADGGQTFTLTPADSLTSNLAVDPQHPNVLYLSGSNGLLEPELLWRSDNSGASLAAALITFGVVNGIVINPQDSRIVYVAGVLQLDFGEPYGNAINLVLRSTDGGVTFTPDDTGLSGQFLAFGIDPGKPARLLVLLFPGSLYETTDSGATWNPLDPQGEIFGQMGFQNLLALNPKKPKFVYLGGTSLLEVEIKH